MPDLMDWLEGFGGAALGVTKGLTAGAEPFNAWERVRTQDLANDRSEISLRDLEQMQAALENPELDYYRNAAAAKDVGNRRALSQGERDIFGNTQWMDLQQSLSDPNGFFQTTVRAKGLEPGSPEYRALLAQMISQVTPEAGVKAYDSFGIPRLENSNLNEQAALSFIESYIRATGDPGATVVRNPDGTVVARLSDGEIVPISGNVLVKAAAMMNAQTPYAAISTGLADEAKIQASNAALYKALTTGGITAAQGIKVLQDKRVALDREAQRIAAEIIAIGKSTEYNQADDEGKRALLAEPRMRLESVRQQIKEVTAIYDQVAATGRVPGAMGAPPMPRVGPTGGTQVTTRPQPGQGAARAAGSAANNGGVMGPPRSLMNSPNLYNRPPGTEVSGPIRQGSGDPLGDFIQLMGLMQ